LSKEPVRCLIVSHAFNMDGRAASQTVTDKIPYFLKHNWILFALSAVTGVKDNLIEHRQVFALGPSGFRFDFRHWCAIRFSRGGTRYRVLTSLISIILAPLIIFERLLVGLSSQWSWSISATVFGFFWIKRKKINVIYSSGGAWSAHLAAYWLKSLTGTRWIAEIHDPLVSRGERADVRVSLMDTREGRFRQHLERLICSQSDLCWWLTEQALLSARRRNPTLGNRGFYVNPGARPPAIKDQYVPSETLNIGYFGSLSETRSLTKFLVEFSNYINFSQEKKGSFRLHIFGGDLDRKTHSLTENLQIQGNVVAHGRIERDSLSGISGRDQIQIEMQRMDCLLLLHGSTQECGEYIPSKLYEYWWASRPLIAVIHQNPQLTELITLMSRSNYCIASTAKAKDFENLLEQIWDEWKQGKLRKFILSHDPLSPEPAVNTIIKLYLEQK